MSESAIEDAANFLIYFFKFINRLISPSSHDIPHHCSMTRKANYLQLVFYQHKNALEQS